MKARYRSPCASASSTASGQSRKTISRWGTPGRLNPFARVGQDAFLLDRHLQHPPQRPVVAVHRARGQTGRHLVVEPVLDLIGGQAADAAVAEAGQDVLVDVAAVRLLGQRRQSTGQREELPGPGRQRHVGAAGVEPAAPVHLDLDLPIPDLRFSRFWDGGGERNRTAVGGFAGSLLTARTTWSGAYYQPPGSGKGAVGDRLGGENGYAAVTVGGICRASQLGAI